MNTGGSKAVRRVLAAVIAVVGCGSAAMFPASATAAWSGPFTVTPSGTGERSAVLTPSGVLRVLWENEARRGVSLVTREGRVRSAKPAAIDREADAGTGINYHQDPVFLADGRGLRCLVTGETSRRARVYLLIYSTSGALVKRVLVADQPESTSDRIDVAPTCQVSTAGEHAVIEFTQRTAAGPEYQGARQIYVARLLPGLRVSAPLAMLAPGPDQTTFIPTTESEQVSVTPAGWVAVTWGYDDILKQTRATITQRWQWRMSWISPSATVGAVIPLTPMHGGTPCRDSSSFCLQPPPPTVSAVAAQRVLVIFAEGRLRSAVMTVRGQLSRWSTPTTASIFAGPGLPGKTEQISAGGGTVVVTWEGRGRFPTGYTIRWRNGRWSKPVAVAKPTAATYAEIPYPSVNVRGDASFYWLQQPFRPPFNTDVTQVAFEF